MHSILEAFAKHRIAPNAVMFIVIFLGLVGLNRINTQYLPDFDFSVVIVSTPWDGASAEDVQEGLAIPVEQAILNLADVDRVSTTSIFFGRHFKCNRKGLFGKLKDGTARV